MPPLQHRRFTVCHLVAAFVVLLLAAVAVVAYMTSVPREADAARFNTLGHATAADAFTVNAHHPERTFCLLPDVPPDALGNLVPSAIQSHVSLVAAQRYADAHQFAGFVASAYTPSRGYGSVNFYAHASDVEEIRRNALADRSLTVATPPPSAAALDLYTALPAGASCAAGVTTRSAVGAAAHALWNTPTSHTRYGQLGGHGAVHAPVDVSSSPRPSAHSPSCVRGGQHACFMTGADLASATEAVARAFPELLERAGESSERNAADGPTPAARTAHGTTSDDDAFSSDATLFYVDAKRNVYIRQNQLRCGTVVEAKAAATAAAKAGADIVAASYDDRAMSNRQCSRVQAMADNNLFPEGCAVGNRPEAHTFRADLQMTLPTSRRCDFPNQATIDPQSPFHASYARHCPQVDQAELCASTYGANVSSPYYQFVFPYSVIERARAAQSLRAAIENGDTATLLLRPTKQYTTRADATSAQSSPHDGQIRSIDSTNPLRVYISYYDATQGLDLRGELVSLVFYDAHGTNGVCEVRLPGASSPQGHNVVVTSRGHAMVAVAAEPA